MDEKVIFKVRKFTDQDTLKVIELLSNIWDLPTKVEIESKFFWQYKSNPFQSEENIYLAFDNEKLIGIRAFVPLDANFFGKIFEILCPSDAIVHPEYRKKGVFSLLNNSFIADLNSRFVSTGCVLNLSSNEASLKGNLNKGWVKTNCKRTYVYRFSMFNSIYRLLNKSYKNENKIKKIKNRLFSVSKKININSILDLRKNIVWDNYISVNRNFNYYEWRYIKNPSDFYFGYIYENDKLISFMILKKISVNQFEVEEYFSLEPENLKCLLNFLQRELKIPIIKMKVFSERQIKYTNKLGMKLYPIILEKLTGKIRAPILVRSFKENPCENDYFFYGKDIRDMNNWFLYNSDYN
ncbi:GNAT family N-acetyltransferase [Aquiflexum lacus]|uniref:GNAT family N-acetyltransferase n=1 Tax=Aquiflexum lacus TaxID=2483805 RepID=UPI001895D897|nr:GNAT family N-acetyltransferase [Aquiflexum lacus]